jgi:LacI family transcriptional regulator, galactose operon repressor
LAPKRVTISDVAAQAGVHRSTVSLALRGDPRITEDTRRRIEAAARDLGYVPNLMARGLATKRTNTIGIVVPKLVSDFYLGLVSSQEEWLRARNMTPFLVASKDEEAIEFEEIEQLVGRGVDGLIIDYHPRSSNTCERVRQAVRGGTPAVMFSDWEVEGVDCVFNTMVPLGCELVRHLLSLGHRRIAVLTWSMHSRRMKGHLQALREFDVPFDPSLVFLVEYERQDVSYLSKSIMMLKDRPTAIVAFNDELAAAVMGDLIDDGYRIPEDISVVGFDDCWFAKNLRVPLTTMRLPVEAMGIALVEMLLMRIESGEEPVQAPPQARAFGGELIVRASTGPPPTP